MEGRTFVVVLDKTLRPTAPQDTAYADTILLTIALASAGIDHSKIMDVVRSISWLVLCKLIADFSKTHSLDEINLGDCEFFLSEHQDGTDNLSLVLLYIVKLLFGIEPNTHEQNKLASAVAAQIAFNDANDILGFVKSVVGRDSA